MDLHPQLAELLAKCQELIAQHDAGNITAEQAAGTWQRLVVFDGDGNQWSISLDSTPPDFVFIRANPDGSDPEVADPLLFAADKLSPRADLPFGGVAAPVGPDGEHASWNPLQPVSQGFDPMSGPTVVRPQKSKPQASSSLRSLPKFVAGLVADAAGYLADGVRGSSVWHRYRRPLTVLLIVVVVLTGLTLVQKRQNAEETSTIGAECTDVRKSVSGIPSGEIARLLGCMDGPDGPGVSQLVVSTSAVAGAKAVFNADSPVTRQSSFAALGRIHEFLGVSAPNAGEQDLTSVSEQNAAMVSRALATGIAKPPLRPLQNMTRGELAVALTTLWAQAASDRPLPDASPTSAVAGAAPEVAEAAQRLIAAGLTDTSGSEAFKPSDPVTSEAWVIMVGRTYYFLAHAEKTLPGVATTTASTAKTSKSGLPQANSSTTAPAKPLPSSEQISAVLVALASGDRARVTQVVRDHGSSDADLVLSASTFAGFEKLSTQFKPGPPAASSEGATVRVELVDKASKAVLAVATTSWVQADDGNWVLTTFPSFTKS